MAAAIGDSKYNLLRAAPVIWFIHSGPMWPRPRPLAGVYVRGSKGPHSNDCNEKSAPPPPRVVAMCHRTGRCWGVERRFEGLGGRGDARLGGWPRRSGARRRRPARGGDGRGDARQTPRKSPPRGLRGGLRVVVALDRAIAARAAAAGSAPSGRGEGELMTTTGDKSRVMLLSATAAPRFWGSKEGGDTPNYGPHLPKTPPQASPPLDRRGGQNGFLMDYPSAKGGRSSRTRIITRPEGGAKRPWPRRSFESFIYIVTTTTEDCYHNSLGRG